MISTSSCMLWPIKSCILFGTPLSMLSLICKCYLKLHCAAKQKLAIFLADSAILKVLCSKQQIYHSRFRCQALLLVAQAFLWLWDSQGRLEPYQILANLVSNPPAALSYAWLAQHVTVRRSFPLHVLVAWSLYCLERCALQKHLKSSLQILCCSCKQT